MKRTIAKILSAALSGVILLVMGAPAVFAATTTTSSVKVWGGKVSTSWFTGKKTSYDISSATQLAGLAQIVNKGKDLSGITFNLTKDIWLNTPKECENYKNWKTNPPKNVWTPIGYSKKSGYYPFTGIFNGNGHTIYGMYATGTKTTGYETVGLFGYTYLAGITSLRIQKSMVYASNPTGSVSAGAIAGIAEGSIINQCENDGEVYAYGPKDMEYGMHDAEAGGIVGYIGPENMSAIVGVAAVEAILGAGNLIVNPLLFNDGSGAIIKTTGIANCVNWGYVYAKGPGSSYSGGIVGNAQNGEIRNCLNLSTPGAYGNKYDRYCGLIAGQIFWCPVINCYSYYDSEYSRDGIGEVLSGSFTGYKDTVVKMDSDGIMKKSTATKLGDAFVYVKGDRPALACMV